MHLATQKSTSLTTLQASCDQTNKSEKHLRFCYEAGGDVAANSVTDLVSAAITQTWCQQQELCHRHGVSSNTSFLFFKNIKCLDIDLLISNHGPRPRSICHGMNDQGQSYSGMAYNL